MIDYKHEEIYKLVGEKDKTASLKASELLLEKDKHKIGKLLYVKIIVFLDENTYLYKVYEKDDTNIIYGIMHNVS